MRLDRPDALADLAADLCERYPFVGQEHHVARASCGTDCYYDSSYVARRRREGSRRPLTGNVLVDTAVLPNLGRIDSVPHLGDGGSVRELWFSPPGRMPLGTSLGPATLDGRLFLTLRHTPRAARPHAATQFLATFKHELVAEHRA